MGRKDAARFKAIEDRLDKLEKNQDKITEAQDDLIERWQNSLIQHQELYNRLIEDQL